jgi:hypothetical protein
MVILNIRINNSFPPFAMVLRSGSLSLLWVKSTGLPLCQPLPVYADRWSVSCHERTLAVQPLTTELDGELPVRRRRSLLAIRRAPDARRPELCQPIG